MDHGNVEGNVKGGKTFKMGGPKLDHSFDALYDQNSASVGVAKAATPAKDSTVNTPDGQKVVS